MPQLDGLQMPNVLDILLHSEPRGNRNEHETYVPASASTHNKPRPPSSVRCTLDGVLDCRLNLLGWSIGPTVLAGTHSLTHTHTFTHFHSLTHLQMLSLTHAHTHFH